MQPSSTSSSAQWYSLVATLFFGYMGLFIFFFWDTITFWDTKQSSEQAQVTRDSLLDETRKMRQLMQAQANSTDGLSVTLLADFDPGIQDSVAWSWVPAERQVKEALLMYPSLVTPQPDSVVERVSQLVLDSVMVFRSFVQPNKKMPLADLREAATKVTYACNDFPRSASGALGLFSMSTSIYDESHALPVLVYTTTLTGDGEYTDVSAYKIRFIYNRAGFAGIGEPPRDFLRFYSMHAKQGRIKVRFTSFRKVARYTKPPVITGVEPNYVQDSAFVNNRIRELWRNHVENECYSPPQ